MADDYALRASMHVHEFSVLKGGASSLSALAAILKVKAMQGMLFLGQRPGVAMLLLRRVARLKLRQVCPPLSLL